MSFLDRIDSVARRIERFVSGNAVADPLYLTNRTPGQKFRSGLLIGAPILAVAALIFLALNQTFDPNPSAKKVAVAKVNTGDTSKVLKDVEKEFASSAASRDIEVLEAAVSHGDHVLSGKVRNNSDRLVHIADIVFDVTDMEGSQLGGVAVRVENIPAKGTGSFRLALQQQTARSALVREVHSR